jgi:hypothetical protein
MNINHKINIKSNVHRKDILKSRIIKNRYKDFTWPAMMKTPYFKNPNKVCEMVYLTNRTEIAMINKFREKRERLKNK